ncbi:pancreatic lipase-related protein 2-like [Rhopilema esculentum]|uniref:pancreatic lipase-related protein 2-like n=1 Tax=Rhopilema esculentum TaxID=499914 RepID=UPI0031D8E8AA
MLRSCFGLLALASIVLGTEVCWPPYGCFNDNYPFDNNWVQLPQSPQYINTKFMLYTRKEKYNPDILSDLDANTISVSNFDGRKKTIIMCHGYLEYGQMFYHRALIDELLRKEDMNVIIVDWGQGALPYHFAFGNVRLIGMQITKLVELMNSQFGLSFANVHLIGFSIGAQLVGHAGKYLRQNNHTVGRISGLDAASPYYEFRPPVVRLDATDAEFVDAMHTDTKTIYVKGFGIEQRSGQVDTYPNGGYEQPNCRTLDNGAADFFTCSHYRAVHYFTESINSNCPFEAYPCKSYDDFKKGKCTSCPSGGCPKMGYQAENKGNRFDGKYFLLTRGQKPFCSYHYKITFHTGTGLFSDLSGDSVKVIITGDNATTEEIKLPQRDLDPGSIESFVGITRHDIGNPLRIKVVHTGLVEQWKLEKVVIRKFGTEKDFEACFNRWLNTQANEVSLHEVKGTGKC